MRFAVWGAGSVGLGLATTLAVVDEPLLLIGRDAATADAIAREGLKRTGLFGERVVPPEWLRITDDPEVLKENPPDWLLICTKAFGSAAVARTLQPFASALPKTKLLICQNGWGNEAPFLSFWPEERLFHARVITGFHRRSHRCVEITAHASPIALGSVFGAPISSLSEVADRIQAGGVPAETAEDMRAVLWAKMLYNCALNPLGALAGRRYGELTADPSTRRIVEQVIREIFDVLRAAQIRVAWANADAYLQVFHDELIPPTAEHESSMLQDLRAGRPTEIEALCGAVESLAREVGVETPVVAALAALVRTAETQY